MLPYGNTPSLFWLVLTTNDCFPTCPLSKRAVLPFGRRATTQMNLACATSPDKSRTHGWLTHPLSYARSNSLTFCTSNRIGVFTFRLSSNSTTPDFSIHSAHHSYQHGYMFLLYFDTDHA